MSIKKLRVIPVLLGIGLVLTITAGCATAKFGKANITTFDITAPSGLVGQDKASIAKALGDPDFIVSDQGLDYWGYKNQNGWYINLYYLSGGKIEAKDLIVEFAGEKVKTTYFIDKGSSIGILSAPMSVAN